MKIVILDHDFVNAVYTTDWHLTDIPPGKRAKGYREKILKKIGFSIGVANKIGGVSLCGGDVFHSKNPRAPGNSFSLLNVLIDTCAQANTGQVYGREGNHDLVADQRESIPHQPIGSLMASGVYHDVTTESVLFLNRDQTVGVQVDSYPYSSRDLEVLELVLNAPPRDPRATYRVVLMHQYGAPGDAPLLYGHPIIGFNRMAGCDYDVALWGHDHSRTETVKIGNCTHVRLGSLSRASIAEDETDRPIMAAVFSFRPDGIRYQEKLVPAEPLEVAFTAADRSVERVRESDGVAAFFAKLSTAVAVIDSKNPREVLRSLCPDEELEVFDQACDCCGF